MNLPYKLWKFADYGEGKTPLLKKHYSTIFVEQGGETLMVAA